MSRIGRQPIQVPAGTQVSVEGGVFTAEGPKGKVSQSLFDGYPIEIDGGVVTVARSGDSGPERSKHGLLRALLANAVEGAANGFKKELDIIGVGYKAEIKGEVVQLALGYSHPVVFQIPAGIKIEHDVRANRLTITGADRQKVGQVAAEIRSLRKPDPYKGKGVKYTQEILRRKVGKAGGK
jgi:large subunit ribosomal protein L6